MADPKEKAAPKKAATKKKAPGKWVPVARFQAYDFEDGKFTDSMSLVELQQRSGSKAIRTVKV